MWDDFTNEDTGLGRCKRTNTSSWSYSVFKSGNLITGEPQLLTKSSSFSSSGNAYETVMEERTPLSHLWNDKL